MSSCSHLNYGLSPSHYLSIPVFSWDAMLKMAEIKLELIPHPDMYIFFEKGAKGGICYILIEVAKPTINI